MSDPCRPVFINRMHAHDANKRPNILAGSGGRQFSFGGRALAPHSTGSKTNSAQAVSAARNAVSGRIAEVEESSKSPFTYALHVVFTSFVRIAERKINTILGPVSEGEPDILSLLGPGTDPNFDKVLQSLAYIARRNPKPVIDSVMFWRKSRSEMRSDTNPSGFVTNDTDNMTGTLESPVLQRRTTDPVRPSFVRSPSSFATSQIIPDSNREAALQSDRKSLVSIFILCRTLIEIIGQIGVDSLADDVADKLEEIVFNQLKNADPESLQSSPMRRANWTLFAQLLGSLSVLRFTSVSDRFVADLEKSTSVTLAKEKEARIEMMIHGMRYLRIRIFPIARLEEASEFLASIAAFFANAHGFRIKQSYAEVLHLLILPVAEVMPYKANI